MVYFILLVAFVMPALARGQDPEPGANTAIEEIVVTARKRAEMIEDTPISVTALSAEGLRQADVTRLREIRQFVPNLQIQGSATGGSTSSQFRIRGIGTTRAGTSFDPGVGVYIDGVYIPGSTASLLNLVDVQQIEVLRGPQGTLFGKNTVGGAVSVTTAKPSDEFGGSLLVRPGNYDLVDTRATLNVPIVDDLAMRFSLATTNSSGYHRNTLRDVDLGDTETIGVLGSLRWHATDAITVDLSGQWNRNRIGGGADQCVVVADAGGSIGPAGFLDACRRSRPFRGQHNEHELSDAMSWGSWGVVDWDLSNFVPIDDLFLKSISSWRKTENRLRADIDATEFPVVKIAAIGPAPEDGSTATGQTFMQELQLGGAAFDGRLKFIAGAFGFWEDGLSPQVTQINVVGNPGGGLTQTETDNWDWALFTQATADVTDWLSVTGGLRYTQEKKGADLKAMLLFPEQDPVFRSEREVFDAWTPMASIALAMPEDWVGNLSIDHLMTYFTYARGFRGGGFNSAPNQDQDRLLESFDPEHVDSFEIGVKTLAFDDRLGVNLAAFRYDYEDIQLLTTELADDGMTPIQPIRNAGAATGQGVELEVRGMPLPGLLLTGSVGYINTEYDVFEGAVSELDNQPIDRTGESFNNTPELQTNVAVQFSLPIELSSISALHGLVTPRLQWYYQSDTHLGGPEVREVRQHGYGLLNARLTYTFMDDRAQIALWGKNLTDEEYYSNATRLASTYGVVVRNYNAPLTYGAEVSYRFD